MKEGSLHRSLRKWVTEEYPDTVEIIKLSTMGRYGTAGWPDWLLLIKPGYAAFIELKSDTGECTELQIKRQKQLRALGFDVTVVNDRTVGKGVIKRLVAQAHGHKPMKPVFKTMF